MTEEKKDNTENIIENTAEGTIEGTAAAAENAAEPGHTDNSGTKKKKLTNRQQAVVSCIIAVLTLFAIFGTVKKPKTAANMTSDGYPVSRDVFLLDTFCEITVYEGGGEEALTEAVYKLNYYDDLFNKSKPDSDISRINDRAKADGDSSSSQKRGETVSISHDTAVMLKYARDICIESNGRLEPAIKPVTDLWDFKDKKTAPSAERVREALSHVKSLAWDVDTETDTFIAYDSDVKIDIGAFAKGFIADRIKDSLAADGVTSAIINLGGNVLCVGGRPDGSAFKIAVKEPGKDEQSYSHIVECDDASVVTAGIYERCFEENGVLYHHIIDPETGYPVQNDLESVTVSGKESVLCDALCTTIFVMGEDDGTKFLNQYNAEHGTDYEVLFLKKGKLK